MTLQDSDSLVSDWRKGRKCATCMHWDRDDMRCYAENPGISTPAYPGFDEDDPRMLMPLDCWDEMDEETKSEIGLAYQEGCYNESR